MTVTSSSRVVHAEGLRPHVAETEPDTTILPVLVSRRPSDGVRDTVPSPVPGGTAMARRSAPVRPDAGTVADIRTLARVLVVSSTAVLLALYALVATAATRPLDLDVMTLIYRTDPLVDGIGRFSELPGQRAIGYPLLFLGLFLWRRPRRDWRPLGAAVLTFLLVNLVVGMSKFLAERPSPRRLGDAFLDPGIHGGLGGFPSGHAANIAAIAAVLVLVTMGQISRQAWRRLSIMSVSTVVLVCCTSWIRATHWGTDLAAGLAAGVMCAGIATLVVHSSLPRTVVLRARSLRAWATAAVR